MKLKIHWEERDGIVIEPPDDVEMSVVDADGNVAAKAAGLSLLLNGRRVRLDEPSKDDDENPQRLVWNDGLHAALTYSPPRPGVSPTRLDWQIRSDGALVEAGRVWLVSRFNDGLRSVTLLLFALSLVGASLLTTALEDVSSRYATVIAVVGTLFVAAIGDARRWIMFKLLDRRFALALSCVLMAAVGWATPNVYLVGNLAPEPREYRGRTFAPREAHLAWIPLSERHDERRGRSCGPAPDPSDEFIRAPWSAGDLALGQAWIPWINQCYLQCQEAAPTALRQAWQQSHKCDPAGLTLTMPACRQPSPGERGAVEATVVFTDASSWRDSVQEIGGAATCDTDAPLASSPERVCWREAAPTRVVFGQLRDFDVISRAEGATALTRHPEMASAPGAQVLELQARAREFEFVRQSQREGWVRFNDVGREMSCASMINEAGIDHIDLSLGAGEAGTHTMTHFERPFWSRHVPICLPTMQSQGAQMLKTPEQVEVVFAEGWVPQARGRFTLPYDYVPRARGRQDVQQRARLALRSATGEWLGTLLMKERPPGSTRPMSVTLTVFPANLREVSRHPSVRWARDTSGELAMDFPTSTKLGEFLWNVSVDGVEELFGSPLWDAHGQRTGYEVQLVEGNPTLVRSAAGTCFFDATDRYLGKVCRGAPSHGERLPPEAAAIAGNIACSKRLYCEVNDVPAPIRDPGGVGDARVSQRRR